MSAGGRAASGAPASAPLSRRTRAVQPRLRPVSALAAGVPMFEQERAGQALQPEDTDARGVHSPLRRRRRRRQRERRRLERSARRRHRKDGRQRGCRRPGGLAVGVRDGDPAAGARGSNGQRRKDECDARDHERRDA